MFQNMFLLKRKNNKPTFIVLTIASVLIVIHHGILSLTKQHTEITLEIVAGHGKLLQNISTPVKLKGVFESLETLSINFLKRKNPDIYQFRGGWNNVSEANCGVKNNYVLSKLNSPVYTYIYTYPAVLDVFISKSIAARGMWEQEFVDVLYNALKHEPQTVFIDAGSNIGVYSLMAAKLGHRVYAIDCFLDNIEHLCASLKLNNFSRTVTLIHNAVSNGHYDVTLGRHPGNVGGTYVKTKPDIYNYDNRLLGSTMKLDDLLKLQNFSKIQVMLKLDIETFEAKALEGARELFNIACVTCVLIEYQRHDNMTSGTFISKFLLKNNLTLITTDISSRQRRFKSTLLWRRLLPCL